MSTEHIRMVLRYSPTDAYVVTTNEAQFQNVVEGATFHAIPLNSYEFFDYALMMADAGECVSVRRTKKSDNELNEEFKRNFPDATWMTVKEKPRGTSMDFRFWNAFLAGSNTVYGLYYAGQGSLKMATLMFICALVGIAGYQQLRASEEADRGN